MESLIATIIFVVCLVSLVADLSQLFFIVLGVIGFGGKGVILELLKGLPWFVTGAILTFLLGIPVALIFVMTRCWPLM